MRRCDDANKQRLVLLLTYLEEGLQMSQEEGTPQDLQDE